MGEPSTDLTTCGLEGRGQALFSNNKTMRDIGTMMEHPEFKKFFDRYFDDWSDATTMIMLLKVYQKLADEFPELNGYERLALVHELIGRSPTRQFIVENMQDWVQSRDASGSPRLQLDTSGTLHQDGIRKGLMLDMSGTPDL